MTDILKVAFLLAALAFLLVFGFVATRLKEEADAEEMEEWANSFLGKADKQDKKEDE